MRVPSILVAALLAAGCAMPAKPPVTTASNANQACKHDTVVTGSHIAGGHCNDGSVRVMSGDSLARQTGGGTGGMGGGR